jgi:uncharacterized protein
MGEAATVFVAIGFGAALAGFVQGLSGFAFSLVAMSVWAWALSPQVAAPLAVFGALVGQVASFASFRRGFDKRVILPLILGGVFGVPIGVFLLRNVNPSLFKLAVGTLLVLYSLSSLAASGLPRLRRGGRGADAAAGFVGGILGGLGGLAGTIPATWGLLRGWKPDVRRATMQAYNIPMHCLTLALYWRTGGFAATPFSLFALAGPIIVVSGFLGARLYARVSERMFTRIVLLLLLASGAGLLIGASGLAWPRR